MNAGPNDQFSTLGGPNGNHAPQQPTTEFLSRMERPGSVLGSASAGPPPSQQQLENVTRVRLVQFQRNTCEPMGITLKVR